MPAAVDITGQRFGRLTAIRVTSAGKRGGKERKWLCRCDCGEEIHTSVHHLRSGNTRSCGCLKIEYTSKRNSSHGMARTPTYNSWAGMHNRCRNPSHKAFSNYGGRGIRVCERWNSFENFMLDMGPRPGRWSSLDRIDGDGDYEPANCRWASYLDQAGNTPQNVNLTAFGETKCLAAWGRDTRSSVSRHMIGIRHKNGWSDEAAILAPKGTSKADAEVMVSGSY